MKPNKDSYNPYFQNYIDLVPSDNLMEELNSTFNQNLKCIESISEAKGDYKYTEGKWSIKELILHCIDTERIFQYRALTFARNDKTNIPGYDDNFYANNSNAQERTLLDIIEEFKSVRAASITLFKSFNNNVLDRIGVANNNNTSVHACGFIICGHFTHHVNILKERYL